MKCAHATKLVLSRCKCCTLPNKLKVKQAFQKLSHSCQNGVQVRGSGHHRNSFSKKCLGNGCRFEIMGKFQSGYITLNRRFWLIRSNISAACYVIIYFWINITRYSRHTKNFGTVLQYYCLVSKVTIQDCTGN